jgi:DNA-binding MarR family transcriptional regulator
LGSGGSVGSAQSIGRVERNARVSWTSRRDRALMNFQQLRIIRETVRQNFNLTEAANVLLTSQSGVSKHIRDLEDELGFEIFIRRGK